MLNNMKLRLHFRQIPLPADDTVGMPRAILAVQPHEPDTAAEVALLYDPAGRSVLATHPLVTLQANRTRAACFFSSTTHRPYASRAASATPDPSVSIQTALQQWQAAMDGIELMADEPLPDLFGWLGWISYDAGLMLESPDIFSSLPPRLPLFRWQLFRDYYIFDHRNRRAQLLHISAHDAPNADVALRRMEDTLRSATGDNVASTNGRAELVDQTHCAEFQRAVQRTLEFIRAGDIYQANIAARWCMKTDIPPAELFARISHLSPAPYGGFFRFPHDHQSHAILSVSPELFIERRGRNLRTRPIKGTRPRYPDHPAADLTASRDLLQSPKEQAELAMIVDLLRNDLGRICRTGSIRVTEPRMLEQHPTVWHTVAEISGLLDAGASWGDIIAALCPAGSISGTPKIRATEIIAELEQTPRGIYCGHMGWIGPAGNGTLNIAIRTAHLAGNEFVFQGGAGIVAESEPAAEYEEVLAKIRAMLTIVRTTSAPL